MDCQCIIVCFLTRCNVYRTSICAQLQQVLGVSVYVSRCGMRRGGEGSGGVAGGTYECKTLVPDSTLQTTFPPPKVHDYILLNANTVQNRQCTGNSIP